MRPFLVFSIFSVGLLSLACARPAADPGFLLRISAPGPLGALDPRLKTSFTMVVKGLVFELLVEPGPEGALRSRVLRSWDRAPSGEYRLELLRPLSFGDGSPVRDQDLIASLQASGLVGRLEGGAVYASAPPGQASVEAQLRGTVLFRGSGASAVGTGPFRLVSQTENSVLLQRVKAAPGRISAVELVGAGSPREAFALALRGDANALLMPAQNQLELLEDVRRFRVVRSPGLHAMAVMFNARHLSPGERRALAAALPIRDLVRAHGPGCEPYPEAPAPARVPPGRPLRILAFNMGSAHRVAVAVGRAVEPRAGPIEVVATAEDPRVQQGEFDLFVNLVQVWPLSVSFRNWHSGFETNFVRYSNAAVDTALAAGDFEGAGRVLEEDPPVVYICRYQMSAAIDARVRSPRLGPYGVLQSLAEWEVDP